MTVDDAVEALREAKLMTMTRQGELPALVELVAGGPVRGSWWGHPAGKEIFRIANALEDLPSEVLVTKLVGGKTTFVHAALWPALYRVVSDSAVQARMKNDAPMKQHAAQMHTASGKHQTVRKAWEDWASAKVKRAAKELTLDAAMALLRAAAGEAKLSLPAR
jgi:hypothetical protein